MNDKFKKSIFKYLEDTLSNSEIFEHKKSIWILDRNEKLWLMEFDSDGVLWWQFEYFNDLFKIFSLDITKYEKLLVDWSKDVLKFDVQSSSAGGTLLFETFNEIVNNHTKSENLSIYLV